MQAPLPPLVVDALVQTEKSTSNSTSKDGFCQTEKSKGTDFQVQVDFQPEKELPSMIQEENMEVSSGSDSNDDSEDDYESEEDFPNDSREGSDNDFEDDPEAENRMVNILDSEVYKIYCQYEDPKNAIEKIKNLKNCLFVHEPKTNSKNSQDIQTSVETIEKFFQLQPNNSSHLDSVKSFILNQFGGLDDEYLDAFKLISQCTTTIKVLQPNGYEYWIVEDFEKGPEISKWCRGHACESVAAEKLAFLNLAGIHIPKIKSGINDIVRMSDFLSDAGIIFNLPFTSYSKSLES